MCIRDRYLELAKMVEDAGSKLTVSAWDEDLIIKIAPHVPIFKVGSGDFTAYPILEFLARLGKPLILSTGLCTEREVLDTVEFIQSVDRLYCDPRYLAVLQCTCMYPIADGDANLAVIPRLKELTGLTVGYSDHTTGQKALYYAAAMGAEILEFHFTDSREGKSFRDHKVSLTKGEVGELISELRLIEKLRGSSDKTLLRIEAEAGHDHSFRRGTYAARRLEVGHCIQKEDIVFLRPRACLLYTSPSPRDRTRSRMPSSA